MFVLIVEEKARRKKEEKCDESKQKIKIEKITAVGRDGFFSFVYFYFVLFIVLENDWYTRSEFW